MKKIIPALIISLGLLALGLCLKSGISSVTSNSRTVDVRGLAEREVMANKVTWPIVCKEVGNSLPDIYNRIEANNKAIIDYLTSNGITADEYTINAPNVYDLQADRYGNRENPYSFNVTSVITVVSSQVDKVRQLITNQGQLLKAGIAIVDGDYNYQIIYEYTELNSIKPDMIAEATRNAREAAKKFAEDSGSSVGDIKNAYQGQFSINDRDPYTPFIKKVRVVSTLTYFIKN